MNALLDPDRYARRVAVLLDARHRYRRRLRLVRPGGWLR